ncbi:MAG: RNA polymerase sigma-70 factor [Chitinophagaceae bacterium]|nr:RNA polymerase sigma-70 factor [Chitinophagaceae bacterium]
MISLEDQNSNIIRYIQAQIALNDQVAFRKLFDFYSSRLINFSFVIIKDKDVAQEIVDDVFIKIWKQRQQVAQINNMRVYLYTAVKNTSLNYLAKKATDVITQPFDFLNIEISDQGNPEKTMVNNELMSLINTAIEGLPPRCKMIFKLVRQDNLKYAEVAEILNISPNTVDAQMVIAVKRISEKLKNSLNQSWVSRTGK